MSPKLRNAARIALVALALPLPIVASKAVVASPLKLIIPRLNLAPKVISPAANSRVSSPLTIRGTAGARNEVKVNVKAIFDGGNQDLGTFQATAAPDGKWSTTPIGLWLPEGAKNAKYQISAIQYSDGKASPPAISTVLPPANIVFRPLHPIIPVHVNFAPQISSPKANARVTSPLSIEGTAVKDNNVSINVKAIFDGGEQDLGTFTAKANADGKWKTIPINLWLPENAKNAKYVLSASQRVSGKIYNAKAVTVLPPFRVMIMHVPALADGVFLDLAPQITSPKANARISSPLKIEGTATKNDNVSINVKAIFDGGEQDLGTFTAKANANGKWNSTPIGLWLPEGAKNAKYEITASRNLSGKAYTKKVTVLPPFRVITRPVPIPMPLPTPLPRVVVPPIVSGPIEGSRAQSPLVVRGQGAAGNTVEVNVFAKWTQRVAFNRATRDKNFGPFTTTVDRNGNWNLSLTRNDINPGRDAQNIEYTITAIQIYPGNQKSRETTVKVKGR